MIYAFQDEKGETINLEFLGLILHNDRRYGFFVPDAEHDEAPGEVMILEVTALDEDDQPEAFELLVDEAIAAEVYEKFKGKYERLNQKYGKEQYLVPYLMSSHPGCSLTEAVELAEYLRDLGYMPEQVQDFYPTPSTISTCMYYTGVDPRTMEPVYVPKNPHEKAMQRALIQYRNPANYELVKEALLKAHRSDLIGFDAKCLIRPRPDKNRQNYQGTDKNRRGQDDRNMGGKNAGRKNTGNSSNQNGRNTAKERPTGKKKTIRNTHNRKKK